MSLQRQSFNEAGEAPRPPYPPPVTAPRARSPTTAMVATEPAAPRIKARSGFAAQGGG